jgi:hypothetical protein
MIDGYYALARRAIGNGVLFALQERAHTRDPSVPLRRRRTR